MTQYHRRDPLAKDRAKGRRDRMDHARNSMTPGQVEAAMEKIIREKLGLDEPIDQDHFRLANLPMDQVNGMFRRVLKRVQDSMVLDSK